MAKSSSRSKRVSNGLVGLSSAAVLSIYAAGYVRTRPAAAKFVLAAERRTAVPATPAVVVANTGLSRPPIDPPAPAVSPATSVPTTAPAPSPARAGLVTRPPRRTPGIATAMGHPTPAVAAPAPVPVAVAAAAPGPAPVTSAPPGPPAPEPVAAVASAAESAARVEAPPAPPAAVTPGASKAGYRDGTYLGWGTSRHGDIQAAVVIEGGRILSAKIAQCLTRYSCSWIDPLPPQVAARQSPNIDYVSGATQSTNAFYDAVVDALSKAK